MKLLTLNTHSLAEPGYEEKLLLFAEMVQKEQPEVFALQEVNQRISSEPVEAGEGDDGQEEGGKKAGAFLRKAGYVPCEGETRPIRKDNHAWRLAERLREMGCPYFWTWTAAKLGYDIYEEGLALFSREPICQARQCFISESREFSNWKSRKLLGIKAGKAWYFSVHMGWWEDKEEPFFKHWDRAVKAIGELAGSGEAAWVMGDFNSPAGKAGEGYEYVKSSGWQDTYDLARKRDSGITVAKAIDGWHGRGGEGMRIDYIWCRPGEEILCSAVVCNGENYPVVSDHYGVMVTTGQ